MRPALCIKAARLSLLVSSARVVDYVSEYAAPSKLQCSGALRGGLFSISLSETQNWSQAELALDHKLRLSCMTAPHVCAFAYLLLPEAVTGVFEAPSPFGAYLRMAKYTQYPGVRASKTSRH